MRKNDMYSDYNGNLGDNGDELRLEDMLQAGEGIYWQGRPDRFLYVFKSAAILVPFALLWLIIDIGALSTLLPTLISGGQGKMLLFIIPFFALHLMPVWICAVKLGKAKLEYKNVLYAYTNRRVLIRSGAVGVDFDSVDFAEIDDLSVNVGLLEKWRDRGSIIIKSQGRSYSLLSIERPYAVFRALQKVSFDVKTDIHYPNAARPTDNPGYNTGYDNFDDGDGQG